VTSVAEAYVDLHVNGDALDGEIRSEVRALGPTADRDADRSGSRIGSRMAAGFLKGFRSLPGSVKGVVSKVADSLKGLAPGGRGGLGGFGLAVTGVLAVLPLLTSAVGALSGTALALVGSIGQATPALLSLAGVMGAALTAGIAAKVAFSGLGDAVKALAEGDAEKIAEAMKKLHPNAQAVAKAVFAQAGAWTEVKKAIQGNLFEGVAGVFNTLANTYLPVLKDRLGDTATVLNGIIRRTAGFLTSARYVRDFGTALDGNNRILRILGRAAAPFIRGLTNFYIAVQPAAERFARAIARGARSFANFAVEGRKSGAIGDVMERALTIFGRLFKITKNVGAALGNVFGAAAGPGNGLVKTLVRLSARFRDFTAQAGTKNAIADFAQRAIEVTGQLFSLLGRGARAIAPLFNPDILGGFLNVFEKALPTVVAVFSALQGALQPILDRVGQALAENGPKIAGLFVALAPLLKGIGSVIGEVFGQALDLIGNIAGLITPAVGAISGFVGPLLTKFAPAIAFVILGFTKVALAIVKVVPFIGKFLAPVVRLAQFLIGGLNKALVAVGKVVGLVFRAMVPVVRFAATAISGFIKVHFIIVRTVITTVLKVVFAVVKTVWKAISAVIGAAVRVVSAVVKTYFKIVYTVISTVLRAVLAIVRAVFNAVRGVVVGAVNVVRSAVTAAFNAVRSIVTSVVGAVRSTVTSGFNAVVSFIKGVPGKILAVASNFLDAGRSLGSKVIEGLQSGLSAVGGFITDIGASVKSAINGALGLPVTINGPGPLPDFTIPAFARGGVAPGGMALVGERGPELVNLPRGSRVYSNSQSRAMASGVAGGLPKKVVLRVGGRDFLAYVEEIADGRIEAADALSWQGA
jgi:phage-related protein